MGRRAKENVERVKGGSREGGVQERGQERWGCRRGPKEGGI